MNTSKVLVNNIREVKIEGKPSFVALDLIQIQPVKSKVSGKHYLGAVKASITTALSPEVAKSLVGTELSGRIVKQDLPESEYRQWTNPRTKEELTIKTQNVWMPE